MYEFASRTRWPQAVNPLSLAIEERRRRGLQILDLTESNPTRCGFSYDRDEILAALQDPRSFTYSPDPRGPESAREAVTAYYAERGVEVSPDQIFLTASTSEAYSYVFRLLGDPGDSVLVPRPSYPLLDFLARLDDVELVQYSLTYDGYWRIDRNDFEGYLRSRPRALVVVNPNNPTGSFVHQGELEYLLDFSRRNRTAIVADEVFADYVFEESTPELHGDPRQSGNHPRMNSAESRVITRSATARVATFAGTSEVLTFTLSGLSKISALPQMKLAWLVVNGPADVLNQAILRLEIIADTYLSVSAPPAWALPRLLETRRSIQPQILQRIRSNLHRLDGLLGPGSPVTRLKSEGGWYAVLKLPGMRSDEDWAVDNLRADGVLTHPGHFYDFTSEGHLVISLLPSLDVFEKAVRSILARVAASI